MAVSSTRAKDASKMSQRNVTYASNDVKLTPEDRPATTESIKLQIISESMQSAQSTDLNAHLDVKTNTLSTTDFNNTRPDVKKISTSEDQQKIITISKTDIKPPSEQSKVAQISQRNIRNTSEEIDAILARKMSSMDVQNGARRTKTLPLIAAVEEEPKWRDIGELEDLRRTKCRRLYSKLGKSKDLALFYRAGKFYAMEAWCSHMGGPLFEGDIEEHKGSCHVMCPWHAYMFELSTGRSDIGLHQQVYPVKCEDGHVFVEYLSPLALYPYL